MYDTYGDGWTGGQLSVSYVVSGGTDYPLLANATVAKGHNASATIQIFSTMPATASAYV